MSTTRPPTGPPPPGLRAVEIIGGALIASIVSALVLPADSAPVLAVILAVAVTIIALTAREVVNRAPAFRMLALRQKNSISLGIAIALAAHGIAVFFWCLQPDRWATWAVLLAMFALAEWACVLTGMWMHHNPRAAHEDPLLAREERLERQSAARAATDRTPEEAKFLRALRGAELDWLTLRDWKPVGPPEAPFGVRYMVRVPSRKALKDGGGGSAAHAIGPQHAEGIAIAMSEVLNYDLESNWVSVEKEPHAGVYSVTVNTEDIFRRLSVYEDDLTPATITEPMRAGIGTDGLPAYHDLRGHGTVVGQTGSGKSALINLIFAYISRCTDAALWVCGTHKLVETIGPWVLPYENAPEGEDEPPFDWIANGAQDTVNMLAAAMKISDWRHGLRPDDPRRGQFKDLFVVLDEAWFAFNGEKSVAEYRGEEVTPDDLAVSLIRAGHSVGVFLILASQRGTHENWGSRGGDINANVSWTAAFKSRDWQEIGRQMGNYQLIVPRNKGEFWLNTAGGDLPIRLRSDYVKERNVAKRADKLLESHGLNPASYPSEGDISWSRRTMDNALDEGSQHAAGWCYAHRLRTGGDLMEYLSGTPAADSLDPDGPPQVLSHTDRIQEFTNGLLDRVLGATDDPDEASKDDYYNPDSEETDPIDLDSAPQDTPLLHTAPQAAALVDYLRTLVITENREMTTGEIHDRAAEKFPGIASGSISNALTKLARHDGALSKPRKGVYAPPSALEHT